MFLVFQGRNFRKKSSLTVDVQHSRLLPDPLIRMKRNASLILISFLFIALGCQNKPVAGVHIKVVMKKYSIDPAVIHVKTGESVALDVTTADVQHGLDIPELGIKQPVQPGRTTTVAFTAPAKGEYRITCGVICGPHHEDMTGSLVVE